MSHVAFFKPLLIDVCLSKLVVIICYSWIPKVERHNYLFRVHISFKSK